MKVHEEGGGAQCTISERSSIIKNHHHLGTPEKNHLRIGQIFGNLGMFSANVLYFLYSLRRKNRKRTGRGVKRKGVTNCWDFCGNFIISMEIYMGIWAFSNSQNSQLLGGIPRKLLGFSVIPTTTSGPPAPPHHHHHPGNTLAAAR